MIKCPICNTPFKVKPSRIVRTKGKICCSRRCSSKYRKGTYIGGLNPNYQYKKDDDYFKEINSREKAYLLGLIASDGSLYGNCITITLHEKDIDILEKIKYTMGVEVPIKKYTKKKQVNLTISSKIMTEDVCSHLKIIHGEKKSNMVQFPNIGDSFKLSFIRGFFDGDGSVRVPQGGDYVRCTISSNSTDMLNYIKDYFNIGGSICRGTLEYSHKPAMEFLYKIYKNSTIHLDRKYNLYKKWEEIGRWNYNDQETSTEGTNLSERSREGIEGYDTVIESPSSELTKGKQGT